MASLFRRVILPLSDRRIISKRFSSATNIEQNASNENPNQNRLILTDSCKKRLQQICDESSFLRVLVDGGGCSGFQYKFELDNKLNEGDLTFGDGTAKVVIDSVSLEYCSGATIDYQTELIRSGFRIIGNPKADHGCSCGASFSIKLD